MERCPAFMGRKTVSIIKVSALLSLVHRFNKIPVKTSVYMSYEC